ncbi:MAG: hypothetical protein NVSMB9_31730 [Isosphaeraceae bacterium]
MTPEGIPRNLSLPPGPLLVLGFNHHEIVDQQNFPRGTQSALRRSGEADRPSGAVVLIATRRKVRSREEGRNE